MASGPGVPIVFSGIMETSEENNFQFILQTEKQMAGRSKQRLEHVLTVSQHDEARQWHLS